MRHLNEYQHHLRVLLEPYDAKVSRTVLRGESPSNGADLLDTRRNGIVMRCFARSLHFIHYLCLQNVKVNLDQTHEKYPVYRFIYRNTIFNRISYLTRV